MHIHFSKVGLFKTKKEPATQQRRLYDGTLLYDKDGNALYEKTYSKVFVKKNSGEWVDAYDISGELNNIENCPLYLCGGNADIEMELDESNFYATTPAELTLATEQAFDILAQYLDVSQIERLESVVTRVLTLWTTVRAYEGES